MSLQQRMIQIVNQQLGGRHKFITCLEKCKRQAMPCDKHYFDSLLYYMNAMYEFEVDFESETMQYMDRALIALKVYERYFDRNGCEGLGVFIELMRYNINFVENLRRLA